MKRTYQPNQRRRAKKHGFFARKASAGNILNSRRKKGRKELVKKNSLFLQCFFNFRTWLNEQEVYSKRK